MLHRPVLVADGAARCDDGVLHLEARRDIAFDLQETLLSFFGDDFLQQLPGLLLDDDIDIQEAHSEALRQQYADGGLAARWHSDHGDIHTVSSLFSSTA